jgi:DNA-binding GntR family transcriptional regulator
MAKPAAELLSTAGPDRSRTSVEARRSAMMGSLRDGAEGTPLAQLIFEEIALEIVEGRLQPWQDLNSVDLGRRFSTSRTPVREALLKLQREGLVVIPARRRPYVRPYDVTQIRDIYQVRAQLSDLVSRQVIERATDADLAELWAWHHKLEDDVANARGDDYFWHNVEFRHCETGLTGNAELSRLVRSLGLRTLQFRHLSLSLPGRIHRSVADHRRLMLAYDERDLPMASAITQSLILGGLQAIERSGAAPAEARVGQ